MIWHSLNRVLYIRVIESGDRLTTMLSLIQFTHIISCFFSIIKLDIRNFIPVHYTGYIHQHMSYLKDKWKEKIAKWNASPQTIHIPHAFWWISTINYQRFSKSMDVRPFIQPTNRIIYRRHWWYFMIFFQIFFFYVHCSRALQKKFPG